MAIPPVVCVEVNVLLQFADGTTAKIAATTKKDKDQQSRVFTEDEIKDTIALGCDQVMYLHDNNSIDKIYEIAFWPPYSRN